MQRLRTLSNLPNEKVFHFGISSKNDIKQIIVDRLCEKAANDCECDCPDSQFSNLFAPTSPPSTTPVKLYEDFMSSEDIKKLVQETVQEALRNKKNIEIKEEYPISSNLALGRPSLFHSYGVSESTENSVVTDGNTCYEQPCCASTEYSKKPRICQKDFLFSSLRAVVDDRFGRLKARQSDKYSFSSLLVFPFDFFIEFFK